VRANSGNGVHEQLTSAHLCHVLAPVLAATYPVNVNGGAMAIDLFEVNEAFAVVSETRS